MIKQLAYASEISRAYHPINDAGVYVYIDANSDTQAQDRFSKCTAIVVNPVNVKCSDSSLVGLSDSMSTNVLLRPAKFRLKQVDNLTMEQEASLSTRLNQLYLSSKNGVLEFDPFYIRAYTDNHFLRVVMARALSDESAPRALRFIADFLIQGSQTTSVELTNQDISDILSWFFIKKDSFCVQEFAQLAGFLSSLLYTQSQSPTDLSYVIARESTIRRAGALLDLLTGNLMPINGSVSPGVYLLITNGHISHILAISISLVNGYTLLPYKGVQGVDWR